MAAVPLSHPPPLRPPPRATLTGRCSSRRASCAHAARQGLQGPPRSRRCSSVRLSCCPPRSAAAARCAACREHGRPHGPPSACSRSSRPHDLAAVVGAVAALLGCATVADDPCPLCTGARATELGLVQAVDALAAVGLLQDDAPRGPVDYCRRVLHRRRRVLCHRVVPPALLHLALLFLALLALLLLALLALFSLLALLALRGALRPVDVACDYEGRLLRRREHS
eukprot:scaffold31867_cov50-Phaeocystis_antarctica.AAC.2